MQHNNFVIIRRKKRCDGPRVQQKINRTMTVLFGLACVVLVVFGILTVVKTTVKGDVEFELKSQQIIRNAVKSTLECGSQYINIEVTDAVFQVRGVTTGVVEVLLLSNVTGMALVWFHENTDLSSDSQLDEQYIGCAIDLKESIRIENLLPKELYIFCLMNVGGTTVSIFDCISFLVPSDDDAWLTNDEKPKCILCVVISLFCCVCLSAYIAFLVFKQKPFLLQGNKRIVLVENQTKNILVMPPDYDKKKLNNHDSNHALEMQKNNFLNHYQHEGKKRINSLNISLDNSNKDYKDYDNSNYIIANQLMNDKMPYLQRMSSTPIYRSIDKKLRPLPPIPKPVN